MSILNKFSLFVAAAILTLTACTQEKNLEGAPIELVDFIGTFEGDIGGIAFWHHPVYSYKSGAVIANGKAGMIFISIEAEPSNTIAGDFSLRPDVVYLDNQEALIYGVDNQRHNLVAMRKNVGNAALEEAATFPLPKDETLIGFCMNSSLSGNFINSEGVMIFRRFGDARTARQIDHRTPFTACVTEHREGLVFAHDINGNFFQIDPKGEIKKLKLPKLKSVTAMDAYREQDGSLHLVIFSDGQGYNFNLDGGRAVEKFTLVKSPNGEPVKQSRAFAMAGGNFGSVYRNGVVAFIDIDGGFYFGPWSALKNGLETQARQTLGARVSAPETDDDLPDIELSSPLSKSATAPTLPKVSDGE